MLHLEVITPAGSVLSTSAESVTAPGSEGEFQVLPSHLPTLAILGGGALSYTAKGEQHSIFLRGGVIEVTQDAKNPAEGRVLVLAEETQRVDNLDTERARALAEAAEAEFASGDYLSDERLGKIRQDLPECLKPLRPLTLISCALNSFSEDPLKTNQLLIFVACSLDRCEDLNDIKDLDRSL